MQTRIWKVLGIISFIFNLSTDSALGQDSSPSSEVVSKPLNISQLGPVRIYRGQEVQQSGETSAIFGALSENLTTNGLAVNLEKSALIKTSQGSVKVYMLESSAEKSLSSEQSTGITSLSYVIQSDLNGPESSLLAEFTVDSNTGNPSVLIIKDMASGSAATFDIAKQTLSCPNTGACFTNCALNKLCSLLEPCELGILGYPLKAGHYVPQRFQAPETAAASDGHARRF